VCSLLPLQHPPPHEEQQQRMLHQRKAHVGIRDDPLYWGDCQMDTSFRLGGS
jgi:hypothetical protein